uniref:ADAM metallopeptidase domain 21 n=1 Tax=Crocodylus porosus TaxID=8502 RepID=A0A7M4FMQ2_CROPO
CCIVMSLLTSQCPHTSVSQGLRALQPGPHSRMRLGTSLGVWALPLPPTPPVVIPRQLAPRRGKKLREISYLLQLQGRGRVLRLQQKDAFVPQHFTLFTYGAGGVLQAEQPFLQNDCFYQGYVQGSPTSMVVLSTCSGGLRGLLQLLGSTYGLEPVPGSTTFQHLLYWLEEGMSVPGMRCGLTKEELQHQEALIPGFNVSSTVRQAAREDWWTHTRYAKVAIVVDHERFVHSNHNETKVIREVLDIVNMADSLYAPLGVRVQPLGLEIWTQNNLITISDYMNATLDNFNKWRRRVLRQRLPHDAGHLFVHKNFGFTLGLAYLSQVCVNYWASGVESFTTSNLFSFTLTFAHELGHNLGMPHDKQYCTCNRSGCIMYEYHVITNAFSNCSYNAYYNLMMTRAYCLQEAAAPEAVYTLNYCGNRVVETGEECDCGSDLACGRDPCCEPNCTLSASAACAFGGCCQDCQILLAGTLCRERTDECDLPEYCNGTSQWCPKNVYVQDGAPCQHGAYCYHGNCSTHDKLCKSIFGSEASVAEQGCFNELNARGDRFGNCGMIGANTYMKCRVEDTLCGRIQCENVRNLPSLENHNTIVQTPIDGKQCWGMDYHWGMEIPDTGSVRDGTPCDKDKICFNRRCIRVSVLHYDCNLTRCHNRGICNSERHCHCEYGWAPPYCQNKGLGGSIDSGPPPAMEVTTRNFVVGIAVMGTIGVLVIGLGAVRLILYTSCPVRDEIT